MTASIERLEGNQVKLNIETPAEVSSFEYEKACRKLAQRMNIPGFRRGKAPKNIVEKYAGVSAIEKEVLDSILPVIIEKTASENNFDLVSAPYLESFEFAEDKSLKASVKLELKPEVKLPDYNGMTVEIEEYKQPEDAAAKELQHTAERFAELKDVTERESNNTDLVNIDFKGWCEGEEIKGGSANNYVLDLGHSNFIAGFAEQLQGHKAGDEFKISVKFPDEYHDEKLKGKDAEFDIKINAVKERILPEINDELAKRVNPAFNTLDDLKNDIQKYLENSAKKENERRINNKIFEMLLEKSEINVQDTMINREIQALMGEFRQRINMQGGNFDEMLEKEGHEKIYAQLKEEALKRIKTSLITGEIAKKEKITVSNEDIENSINAMADIYRTSSSNIVSGIQKDPELLNSITSQILVDKTAKFLASKVIVECR